jgi:hypothetical protein
MEQRRERKRPAVAGEKQHRQPEGRPEKFSRRRERMKTSVHVEQGLATDWDWFSVTDSTKFSNQ